MVARQIDLEEKRVCVPTPMIQEPFFELHVLVASTVPVTVVPTPVVSPPVAAMDEHVGLLILYHTTNKETTNHVPIV